MRLTCSQKDLAYALNITNKAVGVNNTLPVLNNVLIKAEGKKIYFTATNLEVAISCWVEADIKNEGEITTPSKLLTNYINYLKDDKVDIAIEDGDSLLIKTSDSKTKIKSISANEFPSIPTVEKEGAFKVSAGDLKTAISQVVFASATNTTRPILTGIYFSCKKDKLKIAATDSYRLAEKTLTIKDSITDMVCIVPNKTMLELGSVLGGLDNDVSINIVISKNQILFSFDKIQITSRLIEGQFPNYQQVVPQQTHTKITIGTPELNLILKRINLFAKENNNKVLFKTSSDKLKITTDTTQYGDGEVEIVTKIEGRQNTIALNSQFILDFLSNVGINEVVFEIGEKTMPAIFKPAGKNDYIHIIMPLKI